MQTEQQQQQQQQKEEEEEQEEEEQEDKSSNYIILTEKHECQLVESIVQLMYDYIKETPTAITEPDYHDTMKETIIELMRETLTIQKRLKIFENDEFYDGENEVIDLVEVSSILFHSIIIPVRSYISTFTKEVDDEYSNNIHNKIEYLQSLPQPIQRTDDWYKFRYDLITASNAYKAFESQSTKNQLIYEKCKPLVMTNSANVQFVNVDSPLHWGQKYEPLSVLLYETEYNTKIGDFGCIQHPTYSFLGASPDGINIDRSNKTNLYGRMLEIKNVVSREIDGIPKKEYWIQMQLQMEICDLDECDFLETKFTEYESEKEFIEDNQIDDFLQYQKGIIMYFATNEGHPVYIYKPLDMSVDMFELWSEKKIEENDHLTWIKNIYWKLCEFSCVLVLRNRTWFNDNVGQLNEIWNIIENERITGYEHRAPVSRIKKNVEKLQTKCMMNFMQPFSRETIVDDDL